MKQLSDIFSSNNAEKFFGFPYSLESTNNQNSYKIILDQNNDGILRIEPMTLNYSIYTGEHFPIHSYIIDKYNYFPSKLQFTNVKVNGNLLNYFKDKNFNLLFQKIETLIPDVDIVNNKYYFDKDSDSTENVIQSLILENNDLQCCIDIYVNGIYSDKKHNLSDTDILCIDDISYSIEIYYNYANVENINKFINDLKSILIKVSSPKKIVDKSYIYLLTESDYGLDITPHEIQKIDLDIAKYYNDDFIEAHLILIDILNQENTSGIAFLHGEPGTGKTTYLRYLIYLLSNVKCIFIPRDMLHILATPSFIKFLSNHTNSVLILEDCGEVIKTINKDSIVVNLLNYSDGIFGDILKCKIIVTFNEDIGDIDPRLTRSGRCFLNYQFRKLKKEKAQLLNSNISEDSKLSDIFNDKVFTNFDKARVGFK